jgi:putative oxidoreductase
MLIGFGFIGLKRKAVCSLHTCENQLFGASFRLSILVNFIKAIMQHYLTALARILLAQIFLVAILITISQISNNVDGYAAYTSYLAAHGLPGIFAPLTILIQLVFGLGLFLGFKTKLCAYVLAVYAIFIALFMKLQEPGGLILTLQYLAIAGGLILLAVHHKTALSIDNLKKNS